MEFKTQIATTIEQSKKLLELGIKPEIADMFWTNPFGDWIAIVGEGSDRDENNIPAWSLHRLIEMADTTTYINEGREDEHELWFCMDKCFCWNNHESFYSTNLYDSLINCIEWLIKEGYFNKEYLC